MIYINKNSSNSVVATLQENSQIWALSGLQPYYLFSLSSDTTGSVVNFVADNIAADTARTRYDEFNWIETGSTFTNLTGGTINLTPSDFWTYTAYEQYTRDNLDPTQSYGVVEIGKVMVIGPIQAPIIYYSNTGTTNIITYSTY